MRENGGFFLKGIWGLVTLGTQPRKMGMSGLTPGDHSIVLMANGIIALFVILVLLFFYVWNIRDAVIVRRRMNESGTQQSSLQDMKKLWESMYAYIVLSPAAVLLNNPAVKFKKLWRSIYILPWAVPAMISALVFKSMFNGQFGPISQFLLDTGLTDERIYWFTDPNHTYLARILALLINLWLGFPYFMALIGGTLTTVSDSYYEAARMDGATSGQTFWKITFPIVYKATAPLLMLSFVSNFNNFGVIYFLTEGGPANPDYNFAGNTDLLITWLYKLTLDNRLYNMGAVMSIIVFLIVASFSLINLRKSKSLEEI